MTSGPRWLNWVLPPLVVLTGLALLADGTQWVGNFIEDDALISLRYARRLLDGHGLTFNDGERVEGYSNPAWVLLCALLGSMGLDLIDAARVLAWTGWASGFLLLWRLCQVAKSGVLALSSAVLPLAATCSLAVWTVGGLEAPLLACALTGALAFLAPALSQERQLSSWEANAAGVSLLLLVGTRPDAPLFIAILALAALPLLRARPGRLLFLRTFLPPALGWLGLLSFRVLYYGQWLPNPALIKGPASFSRLSPGLSYVAHGLLASWLVVAVGLAGLCLLCGRRQTRRLGVTLGSLIGAWLVYVAFIGGDHFPGYRHLVPVQWLLAVAALLGGGALQGRGTKLTLTLALGSALLIRPYLGTQRNLERYQVAQSARWQWEGEAVALTLGQGLRAQAPLWAVDAAGCLPYFSELPALDMFGLNDAHIAKQAPDPNLPLAHDHGDGRYVLDRQPQLLTFGLPRGGQPRYKSGREIAADARFTADYQQVTFRTLSPLVLDSQSYVQKRGPIGLRGALLTGGQPPGPMTEAPQLLVPGYLIPGSRGQLLPDGSLGSLVPAQHRATLELPTLPPGRYHLRLEPEAPHLALALTPSASAERRAAATLQSSKRGAEFELNSARALTLELQTQELSTLVGQIVITRHGDARRQGSPVTRLVLQEARAQQEGRAQQDDSAQQLVPSSGVGAWQVEGNAWAKGSSRGPRPGQDSFLRPPSPTFNSYRPDLGPGDAATGTLRSLPFVPSEAGSLAFTIGGGRADSFHKQVGLRVLSASGEVLLAFSGYDDDALHPIWVDLSPLAGQTLRLELFDHSTAAWGHVQVSELRLFGTRIQR